MTREEIIKILNADFDGSCEGDGIFQGLQIIAKYINPKKDTIIGTAEHDILYSVDINELVEKGLTLKDANELRELNWGLEDEEYLYHFV